LFSHRYCGSPQTGWERTERYCGGRLGLAGAMALSGAAVSPTVTGNLSAAALMLLLNLRLGQWLPRPADGPSASGRYVPFFRLAAEFFRHSKERLDYCLVADGGIDEFLGLEELLVRRCALIVVSDAGANDGAHEFGVLAGVIRRVRVEHGIQIVNLGDDKPMDIDSLRRDKDTGQSGRHFVCGRIRYPDREWEGTLVYMQMTLTGDEEIDLRYYKATRPEFPNDPIINQFYDEEQIECYRQLGWHSGESLCRLLDDDLASERNEDLDRLIGTLKLNYLGQAGVERVLLRGKPVKRPVPAEAEPSPAGDPSGREGKEPVPARHGPPDQSEWIDPADPALSEGPPPPKG
jgi:hypothetical protein